MISGFSMLIQKKCWNYWSLNSSKFNYHCWCFNLWKNPTLLSILPRKNSCKDVVSARLTSLSLQRSMSLLLGCPSEQAEMWVLGCITHHIHKEATQTEAGGEDMPRTWFFQGRHIRCSAKVRSDTDHSKNYYYDLILNSCVCGLQGIVR